MSWFTFERRWLLAIFAAMLPAQPAGPLTKGVDDVPLDRFLEDFLPGAPAQVRLGLRAATWLITFAPLWATFRPRIFPWLPSAEGAALLGRLSRSRIHLIRELPELLKLVVTMGYFALPEAQRALGADTPDALAPDWSI
jgi:hypothetical protein